MFHSDLKASFLITSGVVAILSFAWCGHTGADLKQEPAPARSVSVAQSGEKPSWTGTGTHPSYPQSQFIVGLGVSNDTADPEGDKSRADSNARAEVGKQIQVGIEQETTTTESEWKRNGIQGGEALFQVFGRETVKIGLEGVQIAERCRDASEKAFYSLAVLNRAEAAKRLEMRIGEELGRAKKFEEQADGSLEGGEMAQALRAYAKSYGELGKALSDAVVLRVVGRKQSQPIPVAEIDGKLSRVVSALNLKAAAGSGQRGSPGQPLPAPLTAQAVYQRAGGESPVADIPLSFRLEGECGRVEPAARTGPDGKASAKVLEVCNTGKAENRAVAELDWTALMSELDRESAKQLRRRFKQVSASFTYSLSTPETTRVGVLINEYVDDKKINLSIVQAAVVQALLDAKFNVLDTKVMAGLTGKDIDAVTPEQLKAMYAGNVEVAIVGELRSTFSSNVGNIVFYRARGTIRAVDISNAQALTELSVESKGAGANNEKAGLQALKEAAKSAPPKLKETCLTTLR